MMSTYYNVEMSVKISNILDCHENYVAQDTLFSHKNSFIVLLYDCYDRVRSI